MPLGLLWGARHPKVIASLQPMKGSTDSTSQGLPAEGRCLAPITLWKTPLAFYLDHVWPLTAAGSGCKRHGGQAGSQPNPVKRKKCTEVAHKLLTNEPIGGTWISQAWPVLLQTLVPALRCQLCSHFMLFCYGGYHREHASKECILFFSFSLSGQ